MIVKIKKLTESAKIPAYSKHGDAGLDLTAVSVSFEKNYVSYKTGLAVEIPEGFVGLLFPRSSNSKMDLILTNSVGVIDSGYRGEIEFRYKLVGNGLTPSIVGTYDTGDRIGQLIIIPYPQIEFEEVEELSETERGTGGYGSTGK
jgi:dUTP pyrophosphatase